MQKIFKSSILQTLRGLVALVSLLTVCITGLSGSEVQLLVSGDSRGDLKPVISDYTGRAFGGLAYRASAVEGYRKNNSDVILLEAGNFLFGLNSGKATCESIALAYGAMNYDAINVGAADFRLGKSFTENLLNGAKLPIISANLLNEESGKHIFQPFITIKRGGEKTAILGLTEPPLTREFLPYLNEQLVGIRFQTIKDALATWMPKLEKQAQHVVILYAGSSVGLQEIRLIVTDKVDVIASAGPGPIAAATGEKKPLLLAPLPQGRELTCAILSNNTTPEKGDSILINSSLPLERKVQSILNSQKNQNQRSRSGDRINIPTLKGLPKSLPLIPDRNQFYKIDASMSNRSVDIKFSSAGLFDKFGTLQAKEGHVLLVLRNSWENTIPLILRRNQGLATTYLFPNLGDHFYAVVNGKYLSRIYAGNETIPGQLSTEPLSLPYLGMIEEGTLVFELQDEAMDCIELRMYDYAHGHDQYVLLGEQSSVEKPIQPIQKNKVVEAGIFEFSKSDTIDSEEAEPGMVFVSVDFRATSQFVINGDATAFDPHAKAGTRINIGTVADWLEADKYTHLIVDGQYAVKPLEPFNQLGANPRFLPDLKTGNRLIFQIPAEHSSLKLRADFPNAKLPDGSLIRPEPIQFKLSGTEPSPKAIKPIWKVTDDTIKVSIVQSEMVDSFAATQAPAGKAFLVLDVLIEGIGEKPEFFQANEQIVSFDSKGRKNKPHPITLKGLKRPTETIWVPNGEHRVCQLVFEVEASETEHRVSYQGYSLAETVSIAADGSIQEIAKKTEGVLQKSVKPPPIVTQHSEVTEQVIDAPENEIVEEEPKEIISLIPYNLANPKQLKSKQDNDLKQRTEIARAGSFLTIDHVSYPDFPSRLGSAKNIDTEVLEDEKPINYQLDFGQVYEGELKIDDEDVYQFEVNEEQAKGMFDLCIAFEQEEGSVRIQLKNNRKRLLQQYVKQTETVQHFKLKPGIHTLELDDNDDVPNKKYRLYFESVDQEIPTEIEFNNSNDTACKLNINETLNGRLNVTDTYDYFVVDVDEQASKKVHQLEIISNTPEAEFEVNIYDEERNNLAEFYAENGVVSIQNFCPSEGKYFILLEWRREAFSYKIGISELNVYSPGNEREPNNTYKSPCKAVVMETDLEGPEMTGIFHGNENDYFLLDVKDSSKIYTLSLSGEKVHSISYVNKTGRTMMDCYSRSDFDLAPALIDLKLPVGLNMFMVNGENCDWAVNVESLNVPQGNFEEEPNDTESWATNISLGETYVGRQLSSDDYDYFKVIIHKAMNYRFDITPGEGGKLSMLMNGLATGSERYETDENETHLSQTIYLLPGQYIFYLDTEIPSLDKYHLTVTPVPDGEASKKLTFDMDLDSAILAEHSDRVQSVEGQITMTNHSASSMDGKLDFISTHNSVHVHSNENDVSLDQGASLTVPISVQVDANAWSHSDILLFAQMKFPNGSTYLSDKFTLQLNPDFLPVGTENVRQSPILPELVGGLNLAALQLGATPVEEKKEDYPFSVNVPSSNEMEKLFDGVIEMDSFRGHRATIKLAGNGSIPVIGTSFELHGELSLWESAKDVKIETSEDGVSWTPALEVELEARTGNQQFLLPQETVAQYARLTIKTTHHPVEIPHFGEWRVISKPGASLEGAAFDLLDSKYGGHLIMEDDTSRVFGFHHNRAAKLSSIRWKVPYPSSNNYSQNIHKVKLSTSIDSPVGPWIEIDEFDVSAADNDEETPADVALETPVWARFVKFEWEKPSGKIRMIQPEIISLTELKHSNHYYSILGEWGDSYEKAGYEYGQQRELQTITHIESSPATPHTLIPDQTLSSAASVGEGWEDWLRIEPQKTEKRIVLKLRSEPFIKVAVEITDPSGNPIKVSKKIKGSQEQTFSFMSQPGMEYRIHIYEPKRSIVFLWDVSGSMSNFVPSIENAILQFATAVNPDTEIVHLLPFEENPIFLLDDWTGDPYVLSDTVRHYDPPSSSYAHINLLEATKKLKDQQGTKAAIIITDCESSRKVNPQLWDALKEIRPVVFTFQTSDRTSHYNTEQDDMQDWASVAGGFYRCTRDASELDVAFEKVKVFLRRPAPYTLTFSTPELKPGFIQVIDNRAEDTIIDPTQEGVLLVIDASASMREKLADGQMKVSAAKKTIEKMVNEYLPAGSHFGMRVFGHRGGENCASELIIPVAPIDPQMVKQKLMFVRSSSLGNTSLAEGLTWAKEDLKNVSGQKRVVVLTDGEETCQGDPAQAIANLASEGLDVVVNIVGFTLGDESVKADYSSWVQATNGKYYDAQDSVALGEALKNAMTPKELPDFTITDKNGDVIFTGQVGSKPIEVKSGKYTVEILDSENPTTHKIEVMEASVRLEYE